MNARTRTTKITPEVLEERLTHIKEIVECTNDNIKALDAKLDKGFEKHDDRLSKLETEVVMLKESFFFKNSRWLLGALIGSGILGTAAVGKVGYDVYEPPAVHAPAQNNSTAQPPDSK